MRKILIMLVCLLPYLAEAQPFTLTGNGTSFTINGATFSRGSVMVNIPDGDTTKAAIMTADLSRIVCKLSTINTSFKRSASVYFSGKTALRAFCDSFLFASEFRTTGTATISTGTTGVTVAIGSGHTLPTATVVSNSNLPVKPITLWAAISGSNLTIRAAQWSGSAWDSTVTGNTVVTYSYK